MKKAPAGILAILICMWAVLGYAWVSTDAPLAAPEAHPVHPQLLVSGPVLERDAGIAWAGLGFVCLAGALLGLVLGMGVGPAPSGGGARRLVFLFTIPLLGAYIWMVIAFHRYAVEGDRSFLGPFPVATTAMMVAGLAPILFMLIYVMGFRRWIVTEEQSREFEALMASKGASAHEGEGS